MHCSNKKLHVMETNFTLNKKERKKGWGGVYTTLVMLHAALAKISTSSKMTSMFLMINHIV